MSLRRLQISNFRCVEAADLQFDPRCNLISGPNASGKTSLLEAIHFLGRGRSFRTPRSEALIRSGTESLMLVGRVDIRVGRPDPIGIRYSREGFEARAGGERIQSLAALATLFPVQAIDPEVHRLIEEGPQARRRYLDWGVFHVEPSFVPIWRRFQVALRQRNAALKALVPDAEVRIWDEELVNAGAALSNMRRHYFDRLAPAVAVTALELLDEPIELALHDGWIQGFTFEQALARSWTRDRESQATQVGPHRADISIRAAGRTARHRVSRGQQKLTAAAMLIGQLRCDHEQGSPTASLLVDDPAAELDSRHLGRLISLLRGLPAQLFVTALDPGSPSLQALPSAQRFHVEHGEIAPLI